MLRVLGLLVVLTLSLTARGAVAKGPVDVIEFSGPQLTHALALLEGDALLDFNPWGQSFLGERLDDKPSDIGKLLTVTMYLDDAAGVPQPIYRFEFYPSADGGVIHLPGPGDADYDLNKTTILDGSGGWYRASDAWDAFYATLTRIQPPSTGSAGLKSTGSR